MPVSAPADDEVYSYLGPQRRWIFLAMTAAFLCAAVSLFKFSINTPWMWPMFAVLVVNVAGAVVSTSSRGKARITAESHRATMRDWHGTPRRVYPSIDVFLPTCGESISVLENTYRHVENMRWGGDLRVYVLDDAASDAVRELAESKGFEYIRRPNRGHMKKAGNLTHAYGVTGGDWIAIFDADFCPRADYLSHLVPYGDDPAVAIVQSPQAFHTTRQMSWLERTAGATQELFYRWVQVGRDRYGAAICVGTCAIYRRAALQEVGGFAQIEHSEDVHTGIAQLLDGRLVRYVPVVIATGLSPDDLAGFLNQQYRWCNGSMSLLGAGLPSPLLVNGPGGALTKKQRTCFWSGFIYYISTAVNVFTIHVPTIVMAGWYAADIRAYHVIPFLPGLFVYTVLLPSMSSTRWRFEVMRTQTAYSFAHALSIADKVRGRSQGWVATGSVRGGSSIARQVSMIGIVTITATLAAGIPLWYSAYQVNGGIERMWPSAIFWGLYLYLMVPLWWSFLGVLGWQPRICVSQGNRLPVGVAVILTAAIIAIGVLSTMELW